MLIIAFFYVRCVLTVRNTLYKTKEIWLKLINIYKAKLTYPHSDFVHSSRIYGCSHSSQKKAGYESKNNVALHSSHSVHFNSTHYLQFPNYGQARRVCLHPAL